METGGVDDKPETWQVTHLTGIPRCQAYPESRGLLYRCLGTVLYCNFKLSEKASECGNRHQVHLFHTLRTFGPTGRGTWPSTRGWPSQYNIVTLLPHSATVRCVSLWVPSLTKRPSFHGLSLRVSRWSPTDDSRTTPDDVQLILHRAASAVAVRPSCCNPHCPICGYGQ